MNDNVGGFSAHLEFGHLLGQVEQGLGALHVHGDGDLQGLVKLHRGRRVEDDADLKRKGESIITQHFVFKFTHNTNDVLNQDPNSGLKYGDQ